MAGSIFALIKTAASGRGANHHPRTRRGTLSFPLLLPPSPARGEGRGKKAWIGGRIREADRDQCWCATGESGQSSLVWIQEIGRNFWRKSRADEREDKGAAERRIACCRFVAKGIRERVGRPGVNDCSGWRGGIRARAKSNSMEIVTSANFPRSSSWSEADMACFVTPQVDVSCPADPHAQRHILYLYQARMQPLFFARVDNYFPTYRH